MSQRSVIGLVAATAVVAWAALGVAQEWSGRARIKVVVMDQEKAPVAGARLTLKLASDPNVVAEGDFATNKKGAFSYLGLKGGSWILRVDAAGFEAWEQLVDIYSQGMPETIYVTLTPLPKEILQAQKLVQVGERYERGQELAAAGDYAGARAEYQAVLAELEPVDRPTVLVAVAATHMEEGDLAKAEAVLDEALAINPEHVGSLRTQCAIVAAQGRMEEAEALLARIPPEEPIPPTTLINIGMAHYNAGEMEAARPFLDRAVAQEPTPPVAHYFRGLMALSLGDAALARADFERFVELEPDHPQAADAREYLSYLKDAAGTE